MVVIYTFKSYCFMFRKSSFMSKRAKTHHNKNLKFFNMQEIQKILMYKILLVYNNIALFSCAFFTLDKDVRNAQQNSEIFPIIVNIIIRYHREMHLKSCLYKISTREIYQNLLRFFDQNMNLSIIRPKFSIFQ